MTTGVRTLIYPVRDLAKAKAMFTQLAGAAPYADEPYYVGFKVGNQDIGLDPNGHARGMTGPLAYWHVDDLRQVRAQLLEAGAVEHEDVRDVGGGKLIASVKDADGNLVGLLQEA